MTAKIMWTAKSHSHVLDSAWCLKDTHLSTYHSMGSCLDWLILFCWSISDYFLIVL